jgi:hypothetical protein
MLATRCSECVATPGMCCADSVGVVRLNSGVLIGSQPDRNQDSKRFGCAGSNVKLTCVFRGLHCCNTDHHACMWKGTMLSVWQAWACVPAECCLAEATRLLAHCSGLAKV